MLLVLVLVGRGCVTVNNFLAKADEILSSHAADAILARIRITNGGIGILHRARGE